MTPEDQALDPSPFFTNKPFTVYRLARARYANLSGVGAALAPGRWNVPGQEAIYTSIEKGVPLLERLAHTPKDLIPSNLALMTIRVTGEWTQLSLHNDPLPSLLVDEHGGGAIHLYRTLADAKAHVFSHLRATNLFAIAVPSVIVPVWNVVLYPGAPNFFWQHVSLENVEPFEFDPRLFPDNTPIEAKI